MWLEGLGQLKNLMTSSGVEPATFRLVAQCPNQLRYGVSLGLSIKAVESSSFPSNIAVLVLVKACQDDSPKVSVKAKVSENRSRIW
jgi:hypothetical protein